MILCPYCTHENIDGADVCEQCGQSLDDLHLPTPATEVERSLIKDRISTLKPKTPVAVAPNTATRAVLKLLIDNSIGSVLVVEGGKLLGIFSERDALIKINTQIDKLGDRPIAEFMTSAVQTLGETTKIAFAVQRMDLGGFRHIPIVDETGAATGIISARDILRYLTDKMTTAAGA